MLSVIVPVNFRVLGAAASAAIIRRLTSRGFFIDFI